jgi:signal transduction histidine kinase
MDEFMFLKYFIPQTWFAGRIFLGAMFAIAIVGYPLMSSRINNKPSTVVSNTGSPQQHKSKLSSPMLDSPHESSNINFKNKKEKIPKILGASLLVLTVASGIVAISSLFVVFPGAVLDDFPIHRPYEIPPLALFVIALLYFYKNQLYRKSDVFYKGVLAAIVIDIFGQIIMSYSTASFDTAHNTAHVLKDAAYFVNIIGLALSSISYNARLKEANKSLIEREEIIRVQYEKLKESDRMKDEFVNVAAHELRTPIQPILGLSEILRPKVTKEDSEYVDVIVRNAKRLQRLTEEILDVTKIESQSLKIKKEEFNLNDVIINCINDMLMNKHPENSNREKKPKILYEPKDILLKADRIRISQVLSNLLSNAIKFTPKDGTITVISDITANGKGEVATISVKDTGQGIEYNMLNRLFEKFTTRSFSGTGLGLFICKSIVEAHGGTIWAENNSDGRGAKVSFNLPVLAKQTTINDIGS